MQNAAKQTNKSSKSALVNNLYISRGLRFLVVVLMLFYMLLESFFFFLFWT